MLEYGLPVLYALLFWWLATGALLYLHRLPASTYRWSMLGMTAVAGVALYGHVVSTVATDISSAYVAFLCGVALWGWLEIGYFTGLIAGPYSERCPAGCSAWRRFWLAVRTSLFHEVGIVVTAAVLIATAWDEPNQVGAWSFVVLWLMRWSAKLNLFLGVPNLNEHWLPEHMQFLSSYMVKRPMNLLFPVSVTAATVVLGLLVQVASADATSDFDRAGFMLVSSLLALGILEHWFLVLPPSEELLWGWALRGSETRSASGVDSGHGDAGLKDVKPVPNRSSHYPRIRANDLGRGGKPAVDGRAAKGWPVS
jgi:putative photosynthetic complex assembly protein 2